MCGIAGIWNFDGRPVAASEIDAFTDALAHRGPDGRGTFHDDAAGIALGHRRLAILDLSDEGKQPLPYADGRLWIVFNGEIYNFLELREELEQRGHRFRSQTDTEVVLAAWLEWGEGMLERFNGMFAFAIFDRSTRRLFLARDRFGIKPLLYRATDRQLAFASELKAFRALAGYDVAVDRESAARTLHDPFALETTEATLFRGVGRLPAGAYAIVENGRVSVRRWWNTLDHLAAPPPRLEEQAERFRELFHDAVRLRMRSDVPIGTCLSGGFDSSAIVCTLAGIAKQASRRQATDWQRCFVATFPGAANDERASAEKVVDYTGVSARYLPITQTGPLEDIERVLFDFEDVYLGLPTAAWRIYREVRDAHVYVTLDGHGADELMGAYQQADWLFFHDAPAPWRDPAENLRRAREYLGEPATALVAGASGWKGLARGVWRHHPSLNLVRRVQGRASRGLLRPGPPPLLRRAAPPPTRARARARTVGGPVTRMQLSMVHEGILPTLLRNFDRLSMAHGVEIRMPFLDWRLACFILSLPDASKIGEGLTKLVARKAMRGHMPESIRASRLKVGFNSPMPEWLRGPLGPWIQDILARAGTEHDLIDLPALRRTIDAKPEWAWGSHERAWMALHFLWFEQRFARRAV